MKPTKLSDGMAIRLLFTGLLILALGVSGAKAEGTARAKKASTLNVWLLSVFSLSTTRSKFKPVLVEMEARINKSFRYHYYPTAEHIARAAKENKVDIVFASYDGAKLLTEKHGFETLAFFELPVCLFMHKDIAKEKLLAKHSLPVRIGLTKIGRAPHVARAELPALQPNVIFSEVTNIEQLIFSALNHQIEGFVVFEKALKNIREEMRKEFVMTHLFKGKAFGAYLAAPHVSAQNRKNLRAYLLENTPLVVKVFQQGMGMGAFKMPHDELYK